MSPYHTSACSAAPSQAHQPLRELTTGDGTRSLLPAVVSQRGYAVPAVDGWRNRLITPAESQQAQKSYNSSTILTERLVNRRAAIRPECGF